MSENRCNYCGSIFDECDERAGLVLKRPMTYGSKYDMSMLELKLCIRCFDRFIDCVCECGAINPLVGEYEI